MEKSVYYLLLSSAMVKCLVERKIDKTGRRIVLNNLRELFGVLSEKLRVFILLEGNDFKVRE